MECGGVEREGRRKKCRMKGCVCCPPTAVVIISIIIIINLNFFSWFLSLSIYSIFYKLVPPKTEKKIMKVFFIYFKLYNIRVYGNVRGNLGAHYFEAEKSLSNGYYMWNERDVRKEDVAL